MTRHEHRSFFRIIGIIAGCMVMYGGLLYSHWPVALAGLTLAVWLTIKEIME